MTHKILFYNCNQLSQVFIFHFFAFSVEVKPCIANVRILDLAEQLSKFVSYLLLASFFVNQIHHILLLVLIFLFKHVYFGCLERLIEIVADNNKRRPLHIWFHCPNQRNWTSNLHVWSYAEPSFIVHYCKNMLWFDKVSRIAFSV